MTAASTKTAMKFLLRRIARGSGVAPVGAGESVIVGDRIETDIVTLQDLFVFEKRGLSPSGKVLGRFAATGILPKFNEKLLAAGIRLPSEMFDEVVEIGAH